MDIFLKNCHTSLISELEKLIPNCKFITHIPTGSSGGLLVLKDLEYLPFNPLELISSAINHNSLHAYAIHFEQNIGQNLFIIDHSYQINKEGPLESEHRDGYKLGNMSFHANGFKEGFIESPPSGSHYFPQSYFQERKNFELAKPALFLDRDGIINRDKGYIYQYSEIEWIEESIQLIKHANEHNFYVFVLTNQSGISQGFYGENDVLKLHKQMNNYLQYHSAQIDQWYYAPFSFRNSIPSYKFHSLTRKPGAGMMLRAMSDFCVDRSRSLMVGDKSSDHLIIDGVKFFHYRGKYNLDDVTSPIVDSLLELKTYIN